MDATYKGDHADRAETEMMLLISKRLVKLKKATDDLPIWPEDFEKLNDYSEIVTQAVEGFPSKSQISTSYMLYRKIIRLSKTSVCLLLISCQSQKKNLNQT